MGDRSAQSEHYTLEAFRRAFSIVPSYGRSGLREDPGGAAH